MIYESIYGGFNSNDEVKQNIKNQKKFKTANNPDSITPTMGYKFQASISNVELIDINRDGLLDIIAGYIFSGGSLQMSSGFKIYVNQGNCFDDQTSFANGAIFKSPTRISAFGLFALKWLVISSMNCSLWANFGFSSLSGTSPPAGT